MVAVLVGAFLLVSRLSPGGPPQASPAPPPDGARIVRLLTGISPAVFDQVGTGSVSVPLKPVVNEPPLLGAPGRPLALYVGAEYCPYCAAERWSLIAALGRFGSFQGLGLVRSASGDVFPDTPTFSFHGSSFTSAALDFQAVETKTRDYRPLGTLTPAQQQVFARLDQGGSIPFLDVGNRWLGVGSGFTPDALGSSSWDVIAARLGDPGAASTKAIVGDANYLTAAICDTTGERPADVCASQGVALAAKKLAGR